VVSWDELRIGRILPERWLKGIAASASSLSSKAQRGESHSSPELSPNSGSVDAESEVRWFRHRRR
jgi:hypothetical protein